MENAFDHLNGLVVGTILRLEREGRGQANGQEQEDETSHVGDPSVTELFITGESMEKVG